jgi:hypothetical protein
MLLTQNVLLRVLPLNTLDLPSLLALLGTWIFFINIISLFTSDNFRIRIFAYAQKLKSFGKMTIIMVPSFEFAEYDSKQTTSISLVKKMTLTYLQPIGGAVKIYTKLAPQTNPIEFLD